MAELDPRAAYEAAQQMLRYIDAFIGEEWVVSTMGNIDRKNLGVALDNLQECAAMLLNQSERLRAALDAAPSEPEAQKAVAPEFCPYCDGSGEVLALIGGGPDAEEMSVTCPRCCGKQTLRAAYDTLAEELPPLQLKVAQLGIFHSHATRYGWAPNQKDGMESFAKLAAQWLAENASPSPAASMEVQGQMLTEAEAQAEWDIACNDSPSNPGSRRHLRYATLVQHALAAKNGWRLGEGQ